MDGMGLSSNNDPYHLPLPKSEVQQQFHCVLEREGNFRGCYDPLKGLDLAWITHWCSFQWSWSGGSEGLFWDKQTENAHFHKGVGAKVGGEFDTSDPGVPSVSLPKANSSPLKNAGSDTTFLFRRAIFQGICEIQQGFVLVLIDAHGGCKGVH